MEENKDSLTKRLSTLIIDKLHQKIKKIRFKQLWKTEESYKKIKNEEALLENYKAYFPDLIKMVPDRAWCCVLSYIADTYSLLEIRKVSIFFKIVVDSQTNVWESITKNNFPEVYKEMNSNLSQQMIEEKCENNEIDWLSVVKRNTKIYNFLNKCLNDIKLLKEKGNAEYAKKSYPEASIVYSNGIGLCQQLHNNIQKHCKTVNSLQQEECMKHTAVFYSNWCITQMQMKNYLHALRLGFKAKKNLDKLKVFIDNETEFKKKYGEIENKVLERIRVIYECTSPFAFAFPFSYSDVAVDGVGVGTVLRATQEISSGIFLNSVIVMYEYERGGNITGVIINKTKIRNGVEIRVGGPCEQNELIHFHNNPNIPQARRVVEGVYFNHDTEEVHQYLHSGENSNFCIRSYHGYASWFTGQLDGEIQEGSWNWSNDATFNLIFNNN